jgi:hypothetical protein
VPRAGRSHLVAAGVALVVLAAALTGGWWWSSTSRADVRGPLASAVAAAPADTTVLGFTDWERVRALGASDPGSRDLLTRSTLADLGDVVPQRLGWGTGDVRWEAFVQDQSAGVLVVAPGPSLGWDRLERGLRDAGFTDDGDGAWSADAQALVEQGLGDQFVAVRLLREEGLLVAAADPGAAEEVAAAATGREPSLASVRPAADTAQALAGNDTVLLQAGDLGCRDAAVPDEDAAQADAAQARAGRLRPYVFSGRALLDRGGSGDAAQVATFAQTFDDVADARQQARVRLRLARGPFIGRTGRLEDELRDPRARMDQATLALSFTRAADGAVLMLGTGPLLPAAC